MNKKFKKGDAICNIIVAKRGDFVPYVVVETQQKTVDNVTYLHYLITKNNGKCIEGKSMREIELYVHAEDGLKEVSKVIDSDIARCKKYIEEHKAAILYREKSIEANKSEIQRLSLKLEETCSKKQ